MQIKLQPNYSRWPDTVVPKRQAEKMPPFRAVTLSAKCNITIIARPKVVLWHCCGEQAKFMMCTLATAVQGWIYSHTCALHVWGVHCAWREYYGMLTLRGSVFQM